MQQDVTVRLIAMRMIPLVVTPQSGVYVRGEIASQQPALPLPATRFHVYCSNNNPGGLELMHELAGKMGLECRADDEVQLKRPRPSAGLKLLHVTSDIANMHNSDHVLVYLNGLTVRAKRIKCIALDPVLTHTFAPSVDARQQWQPTLCE